MRLGGKVAVVTGAGSGIGRAIAQCFAAEGAKLAALDLAEDTARQTLAMAEGAGHRAYGVDVADGAAVAAAFAQMEADFGALDVLVNNAGVQSAPGDGSEQLLKTGQQIIHMEDAAFARIMAVNVNGVFFCTREAVRRMQRGGGAIINMSSIAGISSQGTIAYCASKSAVLGLTRASARELGRFGIRVNAICPGVIDTPMTAEIPEAFIHTLVNATPLGRQGQPEDIARAALYLAGEESSFVTGQWLSPNGGLVMC